MVQILFYFKKIKYAKNVFIWGTIGTLIYYLFAYRRMGIEYAMIASLCFLPALLNKKKDIIVGVILGILAMITYFVYDYYAVFIPDNPQFNYHLFNKIILLIATSVVIYEIMIYRAMFILYGKLLKQKNHNLYKQENTLKSELHFTKQLNTDLNHLISSKTLELNTYISAINQNVCSMVLNSEFKIEFANQPILAKLNINFGTISKKYFFEIFEISEKEKLSTIKPFVLETLKRGNNWRGQVFTNIDSNRAHWFEIAIIPFKKDKKTNYLVMATLKDDTIKLIKQQEENLRLYEEIAFKTSHELRAPIANIQGLAQLLYLKRNHREEDLFLIANHLTKASNDMDQITKEFMGYISDLKDKY